MFQLCEPTWFSLLIQRLKIKIPSKDLPLFFHLFFVFFWRPKVQMEATEISEYQVQQDCPDLVIYSCLKLFGKDRGCVCLCLRSLLPAGFAYGAGNAFSCVFIA